MVLSDHSCDRWDCLEDLEMGYRNALCLPLPGSLYNVTDTRAIYRDSFPTEDSMVLEGMADTKEADHSKRRYVHSDRGVTWKKGWMEGSLYRSLDKFDD